MFSDDEFRELADICKFSFSRSEKDVAMNWLNEMKKLFIPMQEIDVTGIEEIVSPLKVWNVFREDISIDEDEKANIANNKMKKEDGYFYVPKIMD